MTVETRYMRNDEVLGTAQTSSYDSILIGEYDAITTNYLGVRVYVVHADLSTTELTSGVSAIVSLSATGNTYATWDCPQTSLVATDKIRVVVYADESNPPTTIIQTFDTEALGASSLDSATWTVYYYVYCVKVADIYDYYYRYGASTYNDRITNFTWTIAAAVHYFQGDGLTFVTT